MPKTNMLWNILQNSVRREGGVAGVDLEPNLGVGVVAGTEANQLHRHRHHDWHYHRQHRLPCMAFLVTILADTMPEMIVPVRQNSWATRMDLTDPAAGFHAAALQEFSLAGMSPLIASPSIAVAEEESAAALTPFVETEALPLSAAEEPSLKGRP